MTRIPRHPKSPLTRPLPFDPKPERPSSLVIVMAGVWGVLDGWLGYRPAALFEDERDPVYEAGYRFGPKLTWLFPLLVAVLCVLAVLACDVLVTATSPVPWLR